VTKVRIESDIRENALDVIKSAIASEVKRLELGLQKTDREIKKYETRYKVSSPVFQKELAAEDMKKGDEEYVRWAGELELKERIEADLRHLKEIEFVAA
jgi:hypothetical protein